MNRRRFLKTVASSLAAAYVPLSHSSDSVVDISNIQYRSDYSMEKVAYLNTVSTELPDGTMWEFSTFSVDALGDRDIAEMYSTFIKILKEKL